MTGEWLIAKAVPTVITYKIVYNKVKLKLEILRKKAKNERKS